jgi:transcriptional regulator with XRE-family HTH domain
MSTHSTLVRVGHGDTAASTGAKKKPAPTYHDEPARSEIMTNRSHRGTGGLKSASLRMLPDWCPQVGSAITSQVVVRRHPTGQTGAVTQAPVSTTPFGELMREWRQRRRISQLDLALAAEVSPRHVSFMETGRSIPSRTMVMRLAAALDVPPRDQNHLLIAAGLAPVYAERALDDPDMVAVRDGVDKVLAAYEPFPCLAVDRGWRVLRFNAGAAVLLEGVAPHLLELPNALRIALHPDGLAPRIRNLAQWRHHVIGRLRREVAVSGSDQLSSLLAELESYPGGFEETRDLGGVAVPLELCTGDGRLLTFLSTITTFGTALDLTAAELSIEAFLPADQATAAALR